MPEIASDAGEDGGTEAKRGMVTPRRGRARLRDSTGRDARQRGRGGEGGGGGWVREWVGCPASWKRNPSWPGGSWSRCTSPGARHLKNVGKCLSASPAPWTALAARPAARVTLHLRLLPPSW